RDQQHQHAGGGDDQHLLAALLRSGTVGCAFGFLGLGHGLGSDLVASGFALSPTFLGPTWLTKLCDGASRALARPLYKVGQKGGAAGPRPGYLLPGKFCPGPFGPSAILS